MTPPPRIYRPSEVDDAAYGPAEPPALPLPKWKPGPGREREEFTAWCLDMLDRIAADDESLERAFREAAADEEAVLPFRRMVDAPLFEEARKLMPLLKLKDFERFRYGDQKDNTRKRKKSGPKPNPKVKAAIVDNSRLTAVWLKHFGVARRDDFPRRIDILSARYDMTEDERDTLDNYLSKNK